MSKVMDNPADLSKQESVKTERTKWMVRGLASRAAAALRNREDADLVLIVRPTGNVFGGAAEHAWKLESNRFSEAIGLHRR